MIDLARRFNRQGERCRYAHLNQQPTLQLFESRTFDFIYCNIVLQHMTPEYNLAYVRDFLRVLDDVMDWRCSRFQVSCWSRLIHKGAPTALPDEAFRAKLRLLDVPPRIAAASRHRLKVSVRNVSEHVWPALGEGGDQCLVRLGNRWRTEIAGTIVADDGRADLDRPLGQANRRRFRLSSRRRGHPEPTGSGDLVREFVAGSGTRVPSPSSQPSLWMAHRPLALNRRCWSRRSRCMVSHAKPWKKWLEAPRRAPRRAGRRVGRRRLAQPSVLRSKASLRCSTAAR